MTLNKKLYLVHWWGRAPFFNLYLDKSIAFSSSFSPEGSNRLSFNIILQKVQPYPLFDGGAVAFSVLSSISLICENRAAVFTGHHIIFFIWAVSFFCLVTRKMTGQYITELIKSRLKY